MSWRLLCGMISTLVAVPFCLTLASVLGLTALAAMADEGFKPIGTAQSFKDAPQVSESRFEGVRGPSPFDRIALHHVTMEPWEGPMRAAKPNPPIVVLYLPGTNMNGATAPDDIKHSLALFLASKAIDFWALDYRTHYIPSTTPQSELKVLKNWNYELFEDDIDAAVKYVRLKTHAKKIFLAGFSRGVENEYLYTAMHPNIVKGLIVLDGFLNMSIPGLPPLERYVDDISGAHLTFDKRKDLMDMVIADPNGPAPIEKYKTAKENLEHVVYDAGGIFGGHGGLADPLAAKSDAVELAKVLITYDRYWPAVQDYENPFTPTLLTALKKSNTPVIAFCSTNISAQWPKLVADSAQSTGGKDVCVTTLTGCGHLDVLCGTSCESVVFRPILDWLRQH